MFRGEAILTISYEDLTGQREDGFDLSRAPIELTDA